MFQKCTKASKSKQTQIDQIMILRIEMNKNLAL